MALDSMKIFDTVEKHFKIALSEQEVDDSNTVNEIADAVCAHVTLHNGSGKYDKMYNVLKEYIQPDLDNEEFSATTQLKNFIPKNIAQDYWNKLAEDFDIDLPELKPADLNRNISSDNLLQGEALGERTVHDLINWILALNYEKTIGINSLANREEVVLVVIGIINEITGIGVEDIQPQHDITRDLGIK